MIKQPIDATAMAFRRLGWAMDPVAFARDVLGFHPDATQCEFLRSIAKQVLLLCTRQWGKSTVTAVLTVHTALFRPKSLILLTSPGIRQSGLLFDKVSDFLERCPGAFKVDRGQEDNTEDNKLSCKLANGSKIIALPQNPGKIRGYSAPTLIIEDEASEVDDAQYDAVRPMRITVPDSRLVLMSTPKGKRGHFYHAWSDGGTDWERFTVRADQCPRISAESIEKERRARGQAYVNQEFMCEFTDSLHSMFTQDEIMAAMTTFEGAVFDVE